MFGFLIIALVLGAGAVFLLDGQKPATVAATDTPPPAAEQAAATAPGILAEDSSAPAVTQHLRIVAVKPARIEIRSAAGDKMVNREFLPGEPFLVRVGAGWTVSTEDGSAFEWRLGEQSLGLLAPEGPVYSQSVDIAAERPPVIVEPPPQPVTTPDAGETAIEASSVTPPAAAPSHNTNAVAMPPRSRATRPAPETAAPASPPATQPLAAAPPPSEQTPPPVTPQQDPALLAYPGLPQQPAQ